MPNEPLTVERVQRLFDWAHWGINDPDTPDTGVKDYLREVMCLCIELAEMNRLENRRLLRLLISYEWEKALARMKEKMG